MSKAKLLASTAETSRRKNQRVEDPNVTETPRSENQRVEDPNVIARHRGVVVAEPARSKGPAVAPGRRQAPRGPPDEGEDTALAYSISAFCRLHDISESFFHKLQQDGLGPRVFRLGRRTLISRESAAAWRQEREVATATTDASPVRSEV